MKRSISFIIMVAMMFSMLSLISCDFSESPIEIYNNCVKAILESDQLAYEFDFAIGETGYKMTVEEADGGEAKYVVFHAEESEMKVYVDGSKHYYQVGDAKYSVDADKDSVIMQELLDFSFFHEASLLAAEAFANAEFVSVGENEQHLNLSISGEQLKNTIAPDEDVTFGETTFKIRFNGAMQLLGVDFSTVANGEEFYGLPVGKNKEMTASFTVKKTENVEVPERPDDEGEWLDMPAMAIITPAVLAYTNAVGADMDVSIDMNMMGMSFSVPMEISIRSRLEDGKWLTRSISKIDASIMGQEISQTEDVFTDGNGDYEYHTSKDGNYKVAIEEKDENGALGEFNDPGIFEKATVRKSGSNTVVTVDLTSEEISKLMSQNGDVVGDMGEMGGMTDGATFDSGKLVMVVSSDGYLASVELELKASQKVEEPSLGVSYEMTIKMKMDITLITPDEVEVEVPEGYLDYPLEEIEQY